NFDADNRQPPPRGAQTLPVAAPWWPKEDEIDAQVRADLDKWAASGQVSFVGADGPRRFAATRTEALAALEHFLEFRLSDFGPYEDAMLAKDPWMAHSTLSVPLNLGLLDPLEVVRRAEQAYREGMAPLASVEGFIRQVMGWRDYVWHLYWELGEKYRENNFLQAHVDLPDWFVNLDHEAVAAHCLGDVLRTVHDYGWAHHIPRLMVLGNYAMQRGWNPQQLTDWFHRSFVDGYDWVMLANVIGMSQYADGGLMATKPYAGGGAYIDRMSNYCKPCEYNPKIRVGEKACPFTAGYWWFLSRNRAQLAGNFRLAQPMRGLDRLVDLAALVLQEEGRGSAPP
ncbi:MAG: cryptochrome/photolyase family protein, partial [Angustibacter sp.]